MTIFNYEQHELLGTVESVDTSTVVVRVEDDGKLKGLQVNHLVSIQSSKNGQHLIGLVSKIIRKQAQIDLSFEVVGEPSFNIIKVVLIGTHYDKDGIKENVFRRTLSTVPEINAECNVIQGERLKKFMQTISSLANDDSMCLQIGAYSIDEEATAWLNGNKLFQRHAVIVGSTGSGKSWCVAKVLEQVAKLKSANAILFDIHGEYAPLTGENFKHYKIAGPFDVKNDSNMFLPYWLLTYEEMLSLMLDRSDNNAPNQAMVFSNTVIEGKRDYLVSIEKETLSANITLDSPVPYSLSKLIEKLQYLDTERIETGRAGGRGGTYYDKLTRFIQRLSTKQADKRLNFMFSNDSALLDYGYMEDLCKKLIQPASQGKSGIKVINFSEVPSDILPLIVSLMARIIFSVQQWTEAEKRHPVAIFCDEAHLYIPANTNKSIDAASLDTFERISKEGRKYGVGLVVISQRPSEVNRTVLSQSNNFIAMRLNNIDDQTVVKRLLPDSLGDYAEMLPILDIGEALIVGDASLLPSRIKVAPPELKPKSATVEFWDEWSKETVNVDLSKAIESLRKQSK